MIVDSLEVLIEDNSDKTADGIERVVNMLDRLATSAAPAVQALERISKAVSGVAPVTSRLEKAIEPIERVSKRIKEATQSFTDIPQLSIKSDQNTQIATGLIDQLKESVDNLKAAGVSSIPIKVQAESLVDATEKFRQLKDEAQDLKGYEVISFKPTYKGADVTGFTAKLQEIEDTIKSVSGEEFKLQTPEDISAIAAQAAERYKQLYSQAQQVADVTGTVAEKAREAGSAYNTAFKKGSVLAAQVHSKHAEIQGTGRGEKRKTKKGAAE